MKGESVIMYEFTDDCRTGIQQIDEEHKKLFDLINQTSEVVKNGGAMYETAKNLLYELRQYALTHFAHEEKYMEEIHDLELPIQKKEHYRFREKVDSYKIDALTEANCEKITKELLSFMAKWLYRHIIGSDTMIGKCTKKPEKNMFAFTSEYVTGIEFIDEEHKVLFEIIEQANALIHEQLLHDKYDEIVGVITRLKEYTVMHFSEEEAYMESINYEGITMQRYAHHSFIERLDEIDLDVLDDNQQAYLEELVDFLLEWLIYHIKQMDKKIPQIV
jgi:hemerythrin